jgi:hypothetical protein
MAEFDVPKSSPQAIMSVPFLRKGDLIYVNGSRVARLFLFAYADLDSGMSAKAGVPFFVSEWFRIGVVGGSCKSMRIVGILVAIAAAALSGYWMWRRTTATMYYRSANSTIRPSHLSQDDYDAWVIARRKRGRLLKSIAAAAVGCFTAWLLFAMVESGLSRQ